MDSYTDTQTSTAGDGAPRAGLPQPPEELLKQLTLREKISLLAGLNSWNTVPIERLGIPAVLMTDGPHGIRKQYDIESSAAMLEPSVPSTCFPSAATMSCSFDPELISEVGAALGEEARDQEVQLVLGPGINIKRSPLCGRNFEYYSEDPLVAGTCGAAMIRGMQQAGTGACVKHFAANNREYFRMVSNSIIDERALHEIYLAGFEQCIKEGRPYAVMSSYNLTNGTYSGESPALITDTLRGDWGFDGLVVSDWGAVYNRVRGVETGLDLEMPYSGSEHAEQLEKAVQSHKLTEEEIDACVLRILQFVDKCTADLAIPYECDYAAHHVLARRAAAESCVLLMNDGTLPLKEGSRIALIGKFAEEPRYQGGGSSGINPRDLEKAADVFPEYGFICEYAEGYVLEEDRTADEQRLIDEAVQAAKRNDAAVIIAGLPSLWEFEGVDREHLHMPPAQNRLIEAVSAVAPTVVLLCCGAPVEMPWADKVSALVHCYLGGEAGASAAALVLRGDVCPGGKLAETYPIALEDTPACHFFSNNRHNAEYRESIYVGYRYYDAAGKDVLFPFGFGLSYTTFAIDDIQIVPAKGGAPGAAVTAVVTNTGACTGSEVVQVYTQGVSRPYKALAAFRKVVLAPGESTTVELRIPERAFSFYKNGKWLSESSLVHVARSSRDIIATQRVDIAGSQSPAAYPVSRDGRWEEDAFYDLFARVPQQIVVERPFTLNATLADLLAAPTGQFINKTVKKYAKGYFSGEPSAEFARLMMRYLDENPFRALVTFSGGAFPYGVASALLMIANGNYLVGIGRLGLELKKMRDRKKADRTGK